VGKPEEMRPLAKPRRRWTDNIRIHFLEVGWDMDWIDKAQMVGSCEYGNGRLGSTKSGKLLN
jgi:hypothetical protein